MLALDNIGQLSLRGFTVFTPLYKIIISLIRSVFPVTHVVHVGMEPNKHANDLSRRMKYCRKVIVGELLPTPKQPLLTTTRSMCKNLLTPMPADQWMQDSPIYHWATSEFL